MQENRVAFNFLIEFASACRSCLNYVPTCDTCRFLLQAVDSFISSFIGHIGYCYSPGLFSGQRLPYGLAVHPMSGMGGVPGMVSLQGMQAQQGMVGLPAGMSAVQMPQGVSRVPNGMGLYQAEKPAMYPGGVPQYQSLGQAGLLATSSSLGQPGAAYYGSAQPMYIPVSSPDGQQRYMVSPSYAALQRASPSMMCKSGPNQE